jgi:hypothetical protein
VSVSDAARLTIAFAPAYNGGGFCIPTTAPCCQEAVPCPVSHVPTFPPEQRACLLIEHA